jgi:hypothetical protein
MNVKMVAAEKLPMCPLEVINSLLWIRIRYQTKKMNVQMVSAEKLAMCPLEVIN